MSLFGVLELRRCEIVIKHYRSIYGCIGSVIQNKLGEDRYPNNPDCTRSLYDLYVRSMSIAIFNDELKAVVFYTEARRAATFLQNR